MNSITVAIIKPNSITFDSFMSLDQIRNIILEYVNLIDISNEKLMEIIVDTIKLNNTVAGSTDLCYEDHLYKYELCHLDMEVSRKENNKSILNVISKYLVQSMTDIYGSTVLLKMKINNSNGEYTVSDDKICINDITDIIYDKLVHVGIHISSNGTVEEYTFHKNPIENIENKENLKWVSVTIFDCELILYVDTHPGEDINRKASAISGKHIIHGDVRIALKSTDDLFTSINKELFNKFLKISHGKIKDREISDVDSNNLKIKNKLCILEEKYKSKIMTCENCGKTDNIKLCHGCFRVSFCSRKCLVATWNKHKYECLYKTKPIHMCINSTDEISEQK